ncbi:AAA family ATPase [Streptomyces sp. RB6PN25]|uniref:AAA family ATPase n=1 Tax=Streptomyces humicola TaxID=2953240 RepID=A0ABT1PPE2_9ACTN|nr:LuxR family transcriptional regulator [Streptomyces humicola]MCQ4079529.1 AAA family ATPase [Streptomyces humicola]
MKTAPMPLLGRDREIAAVEAMLAGAVDGTGSVLVVSAGAGLGKTALLDAAAELARRSGFTVLKARGSPPERDLPFGLATRVFEPARAELVAAGLDTGEAGQPQPAALHRALAHLASRTSVLVAVDDLHCLDRQSLRWLSTLPHRVDHAPVAVMLTVCPGEPPADPAVLDELLAASAAELHPARVGAEAVSALLERTLASTPDEPFTAAVLRETGGNPLLVTELAAAIRDHGIAPSADSAAEVAGLAVPRLASALHARLRRISPHALDVARAAAVLGEEADLQRVTAVCSARGLDPHVVLEVLTALSRADVLPVTELAIAFAQPLLRTTVLRNTPFGQLQSLHAEAARTLRSTGAPETRVAEHLLATPATAGPWAVAVLREAAATALGRGEPEMAAAHLARALSEPVPDADRTRLLTQLGRSEAYIGFDSAIRHLTEASRTPAPPGHRAEAVRELAELLALTGRHRAAVDLLGAPDDDTGADRALARIELRLDHEATAEEAAELLGRLPKPVASGESEEGRHLSLLAMRAAWAGRSRTRAAALAQQALAALPVTPRSVRPILRCVQVLGQAGLAEDGYERCDALVGHAERWSHRPCLAAARSLRGTMAHRLGRIWEAAEDSRAALGLLVACGAPRGSGTATEFLARLVEILTDLGELDEAAGLVEQAELSGDVPETWAGTALLLARGRLRVACGRSAEGLRDLLSAGNRFPTWAVENPAVAPWRSEAAMALLALGETTEARRHAADAVEQARRWGAPGPLGGALRMLGAVQGGSRGLARLEESVNVLERSSARLELARSLSEYGSALGRAKRPTPARRALRAALDVAEECGCADLARRTRIELAASGGRPPKSPGTEGVAALTAAELRTAMLAAKGKTNRELAEILLVQLRTVEVHLTNAYRKLGIDGRDQLASVLHGRTPTRTGSQ